MTLRAKAVRTAATMPDGEAKTALLDLLAAKPGGDPYYRLIDSQKAAKDILESIRRNIHIRVKRNTSALHDNLHDKYMLSNVENLENAVKALSKVRSDHF
jgi:hypothetical protein